MSLIDPRVQKQADILVNYSLKVKKGDNVVIIAEFEARPLVLEIYKLLIKNGASEVRIKYSDYELAEYFYKNASDDQLTHFPIIEEFEIKHTDCVIHIGSAINSRGLSSIDPNKIAIRSKVLRPLQNYRVENTRWLVTKFPTHAQAQESGMSLSDYEDFVFGAINDVDWEKVQKDQEKLRKLVDKTEKVRIIGDKTDLILSIKGRKAINAGGEYNMPDGEVFTSVVENSTNGFITFTYPAIYQGKEFEHVRLEFEKGKVIKATADKGESDLNKILDTDNGSRIIGELGIGNNFGITKFTKDILFDEKIGGSIHLALGRGYKETLSKNESAIHWDMIKDLRNRGELYFDGKLVQKNGKWKI